MYTGGQETDDDNLTRKYRCGNADDPCCRYLCDNCAWEPRSYHGYGLLEAEKRKPQGTSDVLDY